MQHAEIVTGTSLRADSDETVDAEVWPEGSLEVLSQVEAEQLRQHGEGGLHALLRRSILAILNSGANTDDARAVSIGQPNLPTYSAAYYRKEDWTNGCIAVSNSDMIDIWLMTPDDIAIEIRP